MQYNCPVCSASQQETECLKEQYIFVATLSQQPGRLVIIMSPCRSPCLTFHEQSMNVGPLSGCPGHVLSGLLGDVALQHHPVKRPLIFASHLLVHFPSSAFTAFPLNIPSFPCPTPLYWRTACFVECLYDNKRNNTQIRRSMLSVRLLVLNCANSLLSISRIYLLNTSWWPTFCRSLSNITMLF